MVFEIIIIIKHEVFKSNNFYCNNYENTIQNFRIINSWHSLMKCRFQGIFRRLSV